MAGLFSLGGGGGGSREATTSSQNQSQNPAGPSEMINPWGSPPGMVLYRNEEVYQKGFEIWQQYVQVHHHHHPAGAVIPVAGGPPPNLNHPHFQPHHPDPALYQLGDSLRSGPGGAGLSTRSRALRSGSMGGIGGGINCQDCGNQAKKDCAHMRCRTCCKSRGFDCPTHVKSTWVPAALRRERQQQLAAMQQQQNPDQQQQSQHQQQQQQQIDVMRGGEKRIRHSSSMSIVVPSSRLAAGGSCAGLEVGQSFPSEVSSPAVFRCVRVTSTNDTEEHLAYQTAVSIAGHVFKGILYDQGPEGRYNAEGEGEDSPRGSALQQHNLLTGIGIATGNENTEGEATTGTSASAGDAAGGLYSTPINAFLAGTQFFPPPRS